MGNLPSGKRGSLGRHRDGHLVGAAALVSGDDLSARCSKRALACIL